MLYSGYVIVEVYAQIFNFLFVSFEEESIVGVSIVDSIMRGIRGKSLRIFFQNSFKTN